MKKTKAPELYVHSNGTTIFGDRFLKGSAFARRQGLSVNA
jgi:hypothetical protein